MERGYPVRVEFEDVDSYKIAHHTKLLAYLERGRTHYFSEEFRLDRLPYAILVQKVEMRFIKPARMFDRLSVTACICMCESFKFRVEQKIYRGSELILKAYIDHALSDFETGELIPVPELIVEKMNQGCVL